MNYPEWVSLHIYYGNRTTPNALSTSVSWQESAPEWKQVHGVSIAEIKSALQNCGQVDGFFTSLKNQPIAVITADCVPVMLSRKDGLAIAALHAGWRGTEQKILESFFRQLPEKLNDPSEWTLEFGPSIRACCYEVSPEIVTSFQRAFPEMKVEEIAPTERHLDLTAVLEHQALYLGVEVSRIDPDCTFCATQDDGSPRYFSYRRGDRNSRQFSVIIMNTSSV